MEALEALHTRNSAAKLHEPAPDVPALENILKAALRASDHRLLRAWQFLVIEGEARNKLGDLFVKTKLADEPHFPADKQAALAAKPLRAPMIIVVVAKVRKNPKVPDIEQLLSAGAAAQLMLVAAHAQGYAGIWRTGAMAYDKRVRQGLGLELGDQIVGFVYLGTTLTYKPLHPLDGKDFISHWQG